MPGEVWEPQALALFDIHVADTDAKSYLSHSPIAVLASAETEKKRKYFDAYIVHHATFTLLCFLPDGLVGDEAACLLKYLVRSLHLTWEHYYGEIIKGLQA